MAFQLFGGGGGIKKIKRFPCALPMSQVVALLPAIIQNS